MVAGKDQIYETPHTDISVFTDTFFKFQKWEKKKLIHIRIKKEEMQGLEQSKTIISPGSKQDLLGAMPILLVFLFFPFLQPVCFDQQRTVPQTLQEKKKRDSDVYKKNQTFQKPKTNIGSLCSNVFLVKPDSVKKLNLLLSSGFRYTSA